MVKVFIGSTSQDLKEYREAARDVCLSLELFPVMMEHFEAMSAGATKGSLEKLGECDLYVGIFAHRYGFCEDGYDGKSVTEIEFDTAAETSKDQRCFVIDKDYPWSPSAMEIDKKPQLDALKAKAQKLICKFFTTSDNFRAKLSETLSQWKDDQPAQGGGLSATLVSDPDSIPELPKKLVGRAKLVKDGLKALKSGGHLLLQGFAGMGKTAAAAGLAAAWIKKNNQPTLWLKIGRQTFEAAAEALARTFGQHQAVAAAQDDDKIATLKAVLKASGIGLLVLDDAWNGSALADLLKAVPSGMAVIVTSRRRYPVGELIEVGKLTEADALALLAVHAGDEAARDPAARQLVIETLGSHAFSVEVAGKTMKARSWTPADMIEQIKDAPHDMALPADYGPVERASVKLLLDASLNGLQDENTRKVFLAYGGLFSVNATAEMLGLLAGLTTRQTNDALIELDDHGLVEHVVADGNHHVEHYRLHDLAASYARAQANDELRAKAVDACLEYLSHYQEPGHASFAALRPELDNLLGAAGRALELSRPEECERFAWSLYAGGSQMLFLQGYSTQATRLLEQALMAARQRGDRQSEGGVVGNLGTAYAVLGQVERSIGLFEQVLIIAREIGDRQGEGNTLGNLGSAYAVLGQVEKGINLQEQRLVIAREIGDRQGEGKALGNLGSAYHRLGQVENAIGSYEQALVLAREIGDRRDEGNALGNLGLAYASTGQAEKAIDLYQQHLVIAREIGDRQGEGNSLSNMGVAYAALGQVEKAVDSYEQALVITREIGNRQGEGSALGNLGLAYAALGQVEKATDLYDQQLAIVREIGDRHAEGNALGNIGLAYASRGQIEKAIGLYERRLIIAREIGDRNGEGNALGNLGLAYEDQGKLKPALDHCRQARAIFAEIGAAHLVQQTDANIARVEAKLKGKG